MDIHRCRFVPYQPRSINTVAFSHESDPTKNSPKDLRLALGRSNGDIEIWNPQAGKWLQETVFRGGRGKSIEGLLWTRQIPAKEDAREGASRDGQLRLFSINNSSSVTEWDVSLGTPKKHANGNRGDLWCIAPQPRSQQEILDGAKSPLLAAGSEDGAVVLFSTGDNDLSFDRLLSGPPVSGARVLSITWKDEYTVVVGYDKSRIHVYDTRNKATVRVMTLGKPAQGNEMFVWCLKCLPDGTILSGDSTGELKIWDSKNYSLVQRLKTHRSHVMDITANHAGNMISSVGVDRRTVHYLPVQQDGVKSQRWAQSMHRRFHQHDVKTITAYESKTMSVIVSGGVDTVPVVAPLSQWQYEHHRTLMHLPQKQQLSSSSQGRLMLTWWEHELCIWHLSRRDLAPAIDQPYHTLAARLAIDDEESITSAQIFPDGQFIVLATSASIKLFQLRASRSNSLNKIYTRKVALPRTLSNSGARCVAFSPSSKWLCLVRLNNTTCLAKIVRPQSANDQPSVIERIVKLHRKPRQDNTRLDAMSGYTQAINCIAFSGDSRILAVGDLSGAVDAWVLEGHEDMADEAVNEKVVKDDDSSDESSDSDSDEDEDDLGDNRLIIHGQRWARNPSGSNLPRLGSAIIALTFRASRVSETASQASGMIGLHATRHTPHPIAHEMPSTDDRLVVINAEHQIVEYDVLACRFSDWSRRNPANLLPEVFTIQKERAMGMFEDSNVGDRLWIYGATWLFTLDMSQDLQLSQSDGHLEPLSDSQKKRKRGQRGKELRVKRNTGAGDSIPQYDLQSGVGRYSQKYGSGENSERQLVSIARLPTPGSEDDLEIPSSFSALAAIRRQELEKKGEVTNGNTVKINGHIAPSKTDLQNGDARAKNSRPPFWITQEYRNVFGMSCIGRGADDSATTSSMEIVVVERPMWDVDLPPRFDGGQDW